METGPGRHPEARRASRIVHRIAAAAHHGRRFALIGLALLQTTGPATGAATPTPTVLPPVTIRASVDPKTIAIGDPTRYTVEVSAAPDTEVRIPVLSGQTGDFSITDFGEHPTRKEQGRVVITRWYTITSFTAGDHLVPAPVVQYRVPGEDLQQATGDEVLVGITSLLAADPKASDIRDVKPPEEPPFDWRPYGIIAAITISVGLLGGALYFLLKRPRRQRRLPPRPPWELALETLSHLRAQRYIEQGNFETYFVQLSAIVRRYLEEGFELRAPEMTTEEFLAAAASDARLAAAHRRLLAEFLTQADLVKFARHLPTLNDAGAAYDAARRFVEDTIPLAPGGDHSEGAHAAA